MILVSGAGQLATTSQLSLSKSPSGPILCFPKFDEGLVRLLLNARPAGDRRPDLSRQAEGGHDTVQLEAWPLAPYPDSSQHVITAMFQEAEYEENRNKSLVTRRT